MIDDTQAMNRCIELAAISARKGNHPFGALIARTLGWRPVTTLRDGLKRTLDFYRAHLQHYVPTAASEIAAL